LLSAHRHHKIPEFVIPCVGLDVSLWNQCPPSTISLLNITDSVVTAKLGDFATVFGFTNNQARIWKGHIAGHDGESKPGWHFSPEVPQHEDELIFQGSQDLGMSDGGALEKR
jgi:hypothetical protein